MTVETRSTAVTPMRVAIIAPPWLPLPPPAYGGIEWMCYWLVEGLIDRGHDVTLIASGANKTRARFMRCYTYPPEERIGQLIPEAMHVAVASQALRGMEVDVVHDHTFVGPLMARERTPPTVITAHGPMTGEIGAYYRKLGGRVCFVAISEAQKRQAPELPWGGTVHNAIEVDDYPFRDDKEDFLVFLGRMHPDKAPHLAMDCAREVGLPLVLAGKCAEPVEQDYFEREIRARLSDDVDWIGQADTDTKKDLLARARGMLFPIQWEEPFGIVMVEAMACGTPVVALRRGSVPEVVVDGVTGFICEDPSQFSAAIGKIGDLSPRACRDHVTRHFGVDSMVSGYEDVYARVAREPSPG